MSYPSIAETRCARPDVASSLICVKSDLPSRMRFSSSPDQRTPNEFISPQIPIAPHFGSLPRIRCTVADHRAVGNDVALFIPAQPGIRCIRRKLRLRYDLTSPVDTVRRILECNIGRGSKV